MRAVRFAVVAFGLGLILAVGTIWLTVETSQTARQNVMPTAKPFDHSNCQYPDRTTNPVNGCDNSDPCDPAQTKGGSGDCLPIKPSSAPATADYETNYTSEGK